MKFSVATIVAGRRTQLRNQVDSILRSTTLPAEHVVVYMDADPLTDLYEQPDVEYKPIIMENQEGLPLAAARNKAIEACSSDIVILLDVDCIVSPGLFDGFLQAIKEHPESIISGKPRYLPMLPDTGDYASLADDAVPHPARETVPVGEPMPFGMFWSLVLGAHKQTLLKGGGFDESFTGYGAEDTDYMHALDEQGVELWFMNDYVLHQYHDKIDPPLNHLEDIVANALRYKQKWGVLAMESWLDAFEELGYIRSKNDTITILKLPTQEEIESHRSKHPY